MSQTRAYKELVANPWGFNVYRSVDALHGCVCRMIQNEVDERMRNYWWARLEFERRKSAGRPKRLGKAFLAHIDEQIKRAELIESVRGVQ